MSGLDLTKFILTLFILYGLWNATSAFIGIFFNPPWFFVFEGLTMTVVGIAVAFLMGYIKVDDLKKLVS